MSPITMTSGSDSDPSDNTSTNVSENDNSDRDSSNTDTDSVNRLSTPGLPLPPSPPPPSSVTVAQALLRTTSPTSGDNALDDLMSNNKRFAPLSTRNNDSESNGNGGNGGNGVFHSNAKLKAMADNWACGSGHPPFTDVEIRRSVTETLRISPLNPSQTEALVVALTHPLTLIQGPPGTGKTRTACTILAALVALRTQR
eukprot:gene58101-77530_t